MNSRNLNHWIAAEVAAAAVAAKRPTPDGSELLDERFDKCGVVGQHTVPEKELIYSCLNLLFLIGER